METAIALLWGTLLLIVAVTDYENIKNDIRRQQDIDDDWTE